MEIKFNTQFNIGDVVEFRYGQTQRFDKITEINYKYKAGKAIIEYSLINHIVTENEIIKKYVEVKK